MKLEKKHAMDIHFYLGNILEKDNKYYFLNSNEFNNDEYPILEIGQICVEYMNLDLNKFEDIVENAKGEKFIDLIYNIIKNSEKEFGFIIAALLCNQLITLTNEILEEKNYREFYKKRFNPIPNFYEEYVKRYGEFPDESSSVKEVLSSFVSYMMISQRIYKKFVKSFFEGTDKAFYVINELFPKSMELGYKIAPRIDLDENTYYCQEIFLLNDLEMFLKYDILKIIERKININKCDNCGKYFIPKNKANEKYCDNIFKDNKSCKKIAYQLKLENDEVENLYRKTYKTQNAKKQRNSYIKNIDIRFKKWTVEAKKQKELCKENKITIEEFKIWIKNNENWVRQK